MKTMFSDKNRIKLEINKRKSSDAFKQSISKQSVSKRMTRRTEVNENENTKYKNVRVPLELCSMFICGSLDGRGGFGVEWIQAYPFAVHLKRLQ